jgi:hypothetical protein
MLSCREIGKWRKGCLSKKELKEDEEVGSLQENFNL